jgi:predicted dehydrogenase
MVTNMRKVKWGVIGAGGIADRRTIPGMLLADNCELSAVMEIDEAVSKALAAKYDAKYYYTSADDLLRNEEIEAVYIASPVAFHKQQVIAAAKAHKHVLCEKPIAVKYSDSVAAEKACRDNNILAASGFMMRYHSLHQKMRQIIADGELGQIVSCSVQMNCWFPDIAGNWRQKFKNTGGGALMDMGIHCIDLIEYILGSKTLKVSAFCDTKTFNYDIEDSANVMLKMDNGAVVYISNNYNIPDAAAAGHIEIFGTKGSLVAENTVGQTDTGELKSVFADQQAYSAGQERKAAATGITRADEGNLYTRELQSFSDSIIDGTAAAVPLAAAVRSQNIVEAAYRSSAGNSVYIVCE